MVDNNSHTCGCHQGAKGRLFVLSAPSGGGKSTLKDRVIHRLPGLVYSVSYTTRPPRPGEADGRDYNFVSRERFQEMIDQGDFLEWAEVFGRYYGTGRAWVEERLNEGLDVLADLDVVGAASVRKIRPESVLIFLVPPTAAELKRRLDLRQTESVDEARLRLGRVRAEVARRGLYDYLLVNDDLDRAVDEMAAIISEGRGCKMADSEKFWPDFFNDDVSL